MTILPTILESAHGPSKKLDRAIADHLKVRYRDYSSSVDACLALIHETYPSAHWHVGRAEDGVSLYATISQGKKRVENTDITVPLALLGALGKFLKKHHR